jgi:hypothetical protein
MSFRCLRMALRARNAGVGAGRGPVLRAEVRLVDVEDLLAVVDVVVVLRRLVVVDVVVVTAADDVVCCWVVAVDAAVVVTAADDVVERELVVVDRLAVDVDRAATRGMWWWPRVSSTAVAALPAARMRSTPAATRTLPWLEGRSGGGGAAPAAPGGPAMLAVGGSAPSSCAPHARQNRLSSGFSWPHDQHTPVLEPPGDPGEYPEGDPDSTGYVGPAARGRPAGGDSCAPHEPQNPAPSRTALPHSGQFPVTATVPSPRAQTARMREASGARVTRRIGDGPGVRPARRSVDRIAPRSRPARRSLGNSR